MADQSTPIKNVAFDLNFFMFAPGGAVIPNPSDLACRVVCEVYPTGAASDNAPVVIDSTGGNCRVTLSQTEMNSDYVTVVPSCSDAGAVSPPIILYPAAEAKSTFNAATDRVMLNTNPAHFVGDNDWGGNIATPGTYVVSSTPTVNSSADGLLFGELYAEDISESLSLFRVPIGSLPVERARLNFTSEGGVGSMLRAHRLRRTDWVTSGVTWNTYDGVNAWGAGGASDPDTDYFPEVYSDAAFSDGTMLSVTFDITALYNAAVTDQLDTLHLRLSAILVGEETATYWTLYGVAGTVLARPLLSYTEIGGEFNFTVAGYGEGMSPAEQVLVTPAQPIATDADGYVTAENAGTVDLTPITDALTDIVDGTTPIAEVTLVDTVTTLTNKTGFSGTATNMVAAAPDATAIQNAAAAALTAYDPPTRTEATSDKDAITTAITNKAVTPAADFTATNAAIAALRTVADNILRWFTNKQTVTATTLKLRNDADDADLYTQTLSDNGTTATRGKAS